MATQTLTRGPKMLTDANRRLAFVPDLADYHAPTTAELTATGVLDLSCLVTAADYQLGSTGDDAISDPAACASSNSSVPGRTNYEGTFNFFRWLNSEDDVAWDTFTSKGISGYLVLRIGQHGEDEKAHEVPWAVDDKVQVYQVITGTPQILAPSDAGFEKFKLAFSIQDNVDERAVIATAV